MKKIVDFLIHNNEMKNAGWIVGEQIFQMLLSLVVGVLSARYLGPSNYGSLNYTASFVSFITCIATLSLEGVVIKKMITNSEKEGILLGSSIIFRLISSILSSISIIVIVAVLNPSDHLKIILVSLQSLQLIFKSVHVLDCWFQRYLKSKYVSIGKSLAGFIVATYKISLLITSKSVIWFAVANSINDFVVSIMLFIFYRKVDGPKLAYNKKDGILILYESYHFILSGLMTAIYSQMDRIMIGTMLTDYDVGLYTTATTICGIWVFIPIAIINSFRPKIMELKKDNNLDYELRLQQLYSMIIWLCIVASAFICIVSPYVIKLLFGIEYIAAADALRIAIWYETFAMIGSARSIWIICEGKNKYVKYYLGIGAGVNLFLNTTMIPIMGINGAAMATLITQIITSLIAPLLFKETKYHTILVLKAFTFQCFFNK